MAQEIANVTTQLEEYYRVAAQEAQKAKLESVSTPTTPSITTTTTPKASTSSTGGTGGSSSSNSKNSVSGSSNSANKENLGIGAGVGGVTAITATNRSQYDTAIGPVQLAIAPRVNYSGDNMLAEQWNNNVAGTKMSRIEILDELAKLKKKVPGLS